MESKCRCLDFLIKFFQIYVCSRDFDDLVEFDPEINFLKLSKDLENGTQNNSEGLKIVPKFKFTAPQPPSCLLLAMLVYSFQSSFAP